LAAMVVFTVAVVYSAVADWRGSHAVSLQIAAENENLKKLGEQEAADLAILKQPENREVRDTSQVINSLIRRKEFSWTMIFAGLERIMPAHLHVVSISPKLSESNEIEVRMTVAGDSREKAIELVERMEQSRQFRRARVLSETDAPKGDRPGGDQVQFEVSAIYVPGGAERGGE